MSKVLIPFIAAALLLLNGCVSVADVMHKDYTVSGNVYINEIAPHEGVCVYGVEMGGDASYVIEVTTESGNMIFSTINPNFSEFTSSSAGGYFFKSVIDTDDAPYINTVPFPD